MNAEDRRVVRNVFVLQNVHAAVFDVVVGDLRDGGGRGYAADEEQRRQNHAGFDGDGEIGKYGQARRSPARC